MFIDHQLNSILIFCFKILSKLLKLSRKLWKASTIKAFSKIKLPLKVFSHEFSQSSWSNFYWQAAQAIVIPLIQNRYFRHLPTNCLVIKQMMFKLVSSLSLLLYRIFVSWRRLYDVHNFDILPTGSERSINMQMHYQFNDTSTL